MTVQAHGHRTVNSQPLRFTSRRVAAVAALLLLALSVPVAVAVTVGGVPETLYAFAVAAILTVPLVQMLWHWARQDRVALEAAAIASHSEDGRWLTIARPARTGYVVAVHVLGD